MNYFPAPHPYGRPFHRFSTACPSTTQQKQRLRFVWPRDGAPTRNSATGRWKDLFLNQGPDIFVSRGPSRPQKASWTNRYNLWPDMLLPNDTVDAMPWARRSSEMRFDFRRRRYGRDDRWTWADAVWSGNRWERNYPRAWRCTHGQWYQLGPDVWGGVPGLGADGHGLPGRHPWFPVVESHPDFWDGMGDGEEEGDWSGDM